LNVASLPIGFARRARNEFSFRQPVDNVDRGVMSYLVIIAAVKLSKAPKRSPMTHRAIPVN